MAHYRILHQMNKTMNLGIKLGGFEFLEDLGPFENNSRLFVFSKKGFRAFLNSFKLILLFLI